MWSTNITMQWWPVSEVSRSVMKSMPILCQWPLVIACGSRRPMGLPLLWLVRWDKSQPTMYCQRLLDICSQKYQYFMCKYDWSTPRCHPAGATWASWRICHYINFGMHNRPLCSAIPSSSVFFTLPVTSTPSSSSFFFAFALLSNCFFSKSPSNYGRPFSSI